MTDSRLSRELTLDGVDNIRDLGGLPTDDGGTTRRGVLLRASTLQHLAHADAERLASEVGVRMVIDLRDPVEVEREGRGPLATLVEGYANLTIRSGDALPADVVPDAVEMQIDLAQHYASYLDASTEEILSIARLVIDAANHVALFHCAAGKDRTGVVAAVLLDAAGVTEEAIVADYVATQANADRIFARLRRLESYRYLDELPAHIRTAEPETMQRFLDMLYSDHGGAAAWLRDHGLGADELTALRAAIVEPA